MQATLQRLLLSISDRLARVAGSSAAECRSSLESGAGAERLGAVRGAARGARLGHHHGRHHAAAAEVGALALLERAGEAVGAPAGEAVGTHHGDHHVAAGLPEALAGVKHPLVTGLEAGAGVEDRALKAEVDARL